MSESGSTARGSRAARTAPLPDEDAVVARAVAGDRGAFTRLIEHYQSACYGLAYRLLGDPDQAADAAQDAFVHAYDAMAKYRGGLFRSWMLRITANASYDIVRRAQRRPTTTLPDAEEGEPDLPDTTVADPADEAGRSGRTRRSPTPPTRPAVQSCIGTSTSRSDTCRRTSALRSCCAMSTAWITARWPPPRPPRSERSNRVSIAGACVCAS